MVWLWTLISRTASHLLMNWTVTCVKHVLHHIWNASSSSSSSSSPVFVRIEPKVLQHLVQEPEAERQLQQMCFHFSKFSITIGIGFLWWFSTLYSYLLHTLFRGQFVKLREGIQSLWINSPQPRLFQGWFSGCHQGASTSFAFVVVSLLSISSLESTLIPATLGLGVECVKGKWGNFFWLGTNRISERERETDDDDDDDDGDFHEVHFLFWLDERGWSVPSDSRIRGFRGLIVGGLSYLSSRSSSTGCPLSREWADESPS